MKTPISISLALAVAALSAVGQAQASSGTLYRCDSADGRSTYSSSRIPGSTCKAVTSYTRQPAPPMPMPAPVAAPAPVPAEAATTASPPAPASAAPVAAPAPAASASTRRVTGNLYSYMVNGVTHFSATPPKGASNVRRVPYSYMETCFACAPQPRVNFGNVRLNVNAYQAEIAEASRMHGVDEAIIRAIMHAESAYNPNALSHAGAQGLMQLMPATARRFGVTNAFEPRQNIQGGVRYLAWLLRRFNGDLTLAAAGYNAGEGAVDRYKGVPPYNETRRYVERVRMLADRYRGYRTAAN